MQGATSACKRSERMGDVSVGCGTAAPSSRRGSGDSGGSGGPPRPAQQRFWLAILKRERQLSLFMSRSNCLSAAITNCFLHTARDSRNHSQELNSISPRHLHSPATRHPDRLSVDIAHQRTRQRQNRTRRLRRCTWSPQRDVHMLHALGRRLLRRRYAERDLLAIGRCDESTRFLRRRQPRLDVTESDRVCAYTELRAPSMHVLEW
jgi:hypothetical protein